MECYQQDLATHYCWYLYLFDPSVWYFQEDHTVVSLRWSKTDTTYTNKLSSCDDADLLLHTVLLLLHNESYTSIPLVSGKNKTATQKNSKSEWLYWKFGDSLRSTSGLHILFSHLLLRSITCIKNQGRSQDTGDQICSD